jgi:hypothetical protein
MLCKAYIVRESNEKAECLMFTNHPMLGASTAVNTERRWRIKPHLRSCHLVRYSDRLQLSNFKMSSSNVSENKFLPRVLFRMSAIFLDILGIRLHGVTKIRDSQTKTAISGGKTLPFGIKFRRMLYRNFLPNLVVTHCGFTKVAHGLIERTS